MKKPSFYIIAGESSGDQYGADLVRALAQSVKADFFGFGGIEMEKAGVKLSRTLDKLAVVGFTEVLVRMKTIRNNFRIAKRDLLTIRPDAVILIDYPGFNLRMAKWAKKRGFRVFYYVAPQTWAWKAGRNAQIKDYTDQVFVILPFEKDYFQKQGIDVMYVGHPLVDRIRDWKSQYTNKCPYIFPNDQPVIAVLPGSRQGEIRKMSPVLLSMIKSMRDFNFAIAALKSNPEKLYQAFDQEENVRVVYDKTSEIMENADFGLIKSGTSTLQAAIFKLPHIVFYKVSPISAWIMRRLATIDYAALPNLILDQQVVPELLQEDFTSLIAEKKLRELAGDQASELQFKAFDKIEALLHKNESTATLVASFIQNAISV